MTSYFPKETKGYAWFHETQVNVASSMFLRQKQEVIISIWSMGGETFHGMFDFVISPEQGPTRLVLHHTLLYCMLVQQETLMVDHINKYSKKM